MRFVFCLTLVPGLLPRAFCDEAAPAAAPKKQPVEQIERFWGKEFSGPFASETSAGESRQVQDALAKLCPDRPRKRDQNRWDLSPAYVWKFDSAGKKASSLVLERDWIVSIPGTTRIRLTVVDSSGTVRGEAEFQTGGRNILTKAKLEQVKGIEFPVLVLDTVASFGNDRQFYALIDGRFDLIRVQNRKEMADRNRYFSGNGGCGPPPPKQSEQQWETDLYSSDRARVLRALTWLSGIHDVPNAKSGPTAAPRVRKRAAVAARLHELAKQGDVWEREAAILALDPKDYEH